MKTRLFTLFLLFTFIVTAAAFGTKETENSRNGEVVVYAYDSFTADWGPGNEIVRLFEEKTGFKCTMISTGNAVQVLSRAVLEKEAPQADILIGIDSQLFEKAKSLDILQSYKPENVGNLIDGDLLFDDSWTLTPYDWSHFAIIYDSEALNDKTGIPVPTSIEDLTNPVYSKKLILMDPRTSTPGLGFVTWTVALFGEKYTDYWRALKPNILTMAPGWDAGYGLFTSGEAPLVISYTTSAAYHVECDNSSRFKCLIFDEGHPMQVEGAGIVKNCANEKGAKAFMDFLISTEAQNVIPLTQWMYPANSKVILPSCYDASPAASKTLTADSNLLGNAADTVMAILSE